MRTSVILHKLGAVELPLIRASHGFEACCNLRFTGKSSPPSPSQPHSLKPLHYCYCWVPLFTCVNL